MKGIGGLEHGHRDRLLHDVLWQLGLQRQTCEQQQRDKEFTHGVRFFYINAELCFFVLRAQNYEKRPPHSEATLKNSESVVFTA